MTKNAHTATDLSHAFGGALDRACGELGLVLSVAQKSKLLAYLGALLLWNKAYNLTAIKDPKDALVKHIFDCLAIVPSFEKCCLGKSSPRILDIGTGAGLPALVLAIVRPDWHITALDSNSKKIRFIRQMTAELLLDNVSPIASRIEDFAGAFDVITSRAFASLSDFVHLARPYLHPDGVLCAMKGKAPMEEMAILTDWRYEIVPLSVPDLMEERCLVNLVRI